jgi:predicted nucleic acid-binding protein
MSSRSQNRSMANYQPIVRANVVDIKTDRPQKSDRFLIDTNAWYWLAYSRSEETLRPPKTYQITQYPRYIHAALKEMSNLFWSGLSMAELTTLIERSEYDIFCQKNQLEPNLFPLKEYRHDHPSERANQLIPRIIIAWNFVENVGQCLESIIHQETVTQAIEDLKNQEVDGYDGLMVHAAKTANISQIITDDIDFITVPGITVFTANRNAISVAKSQNKLIDRSNVGKAIQRPQRK